MSDTGRITFAVFDGSNNPVTGLVLSFTTYKNQSGTNMSTPIITELGNGFYYFTATFSSANTAICYLIETGNQPAVVYGYVRQEDFNLTDLPASPQQVAFALFNTDYTPATGQVLTFTTYNNENGTPITPPGISELGGGFYRFAPVFDSSHTAFAYLIDTAGTIQPAVVYGYIDETDFSPPAPTPPEPSLFNTLSTTTTTINYGQDTYDLTDLPLIDTQIDGITNIALRIARRLTTPYGALGAINDDPDFGYDVFQLLNIASNQGLLIAARSDIETECLKDEEIQDATVDLESQGSGISITVDLTASTGPFQLVMNIQDVTYATLQINPN